MNSVASPKAVRPWPGHRSAGRVSEGFRCHYLLVALGYEDVAKSQFGDGAAPRCRIHRGCVRVMRVCR